MKLKHQRLITYSIVCLMVAVAAMLTFRNLESFMVYFYAPSDIVNTPPALDQHIRVGGLVVDDTVAYPEPGKVRFDITDNETTITVHYKGLLPSLFREGQGIIAEGIYDGQAVQASSILAKHDEYYMPAEVAKTLREQGRWKGDTPAQGKSQ